MTDIIYFKQNFEKAVVGNYNHDKFLEDWRYPSYLATAISGEILENIKIIDCPDAGFPSKAIKCILPAYCNGPETGGGIWYTALTANSYTTKINEVYLTFKIKFSDGFVWDNRRIYLPGLTGPNWDPGPGGEYISLLCARNESLFFKIVDKSKDEPFYKKWNFSFESGTWYTITLRLALNSESDNNDGIVEGFINGQLKCQENNLRFRDNNTVRIHAILMQIYSWEFIENENYTDSWIEIDDVIAYDYDPQFKEENNIATGNNCMSSDAGFRLPAPRLEDRFIQ